MKLTEIFTFKRIIIGLVIVFGILALSKIDSCSGSKFAAQQATIDSFRLANQQLVQEKNKLNQTVSSQAVIITTTQDNFKQLVEDDFKLQKKYENRIKQVNSYVRVKTSTGVKDVAIPYEQDTVTIVSNECPENYVATPKSVKIDSTQNPNFQFSAVVEKDSLRIKSINFPDSQHIAIVETKGGFFKRDITGKVRFYIKPTMEVMVLHTNPYIDVKGMSSIVFKPPTKGRWLERIVIAAASAFITFKLLK